MNVCAVIACAVLAFSIASAQDAFIFVDVSNKTAPENLIAAPLEELSDELQSARADALLLYTDFASRAGSDLKTFLKNVTWMAHDVLSNLDAAVYNDSDECWVALKGRIKKIEHDARKAAIYSGDSHHKFLLGHMIVFRMHLNKSEDYLKRSDKAMKGCGYSCESTPRVKRWRRLALDEIHRVRNDLDHSRLSYRDIVSHARRKLNHLKKQAISKAKDAVEEYKYCIGGL